MGQNPSTARAANIAQSMISVSTIVAKNATLQNQNITSIDQNVYIYNVKGDVSVEFGGSTRLVVDVSGMQTSYFNGDFDNEIVNTVSQIASAMAESMPIFSGETSSETVNMTTMITELVQEINEAYMMECSSTTVIDQSAIIHDVEGNVSVTFDNDTYIDATLNCSQNTSSVVSISNKITNTIEQKAESETKSSLWSVIIACTLIIIVCALIIFVSYSSLIKLFLFVLAFIIVGVGLWVLSAWMLGAPPFADDTPAPPNEEYKPPPPGELGERPENMVGYTLLGAGESAQLDFYNGQEIAVGTLLTITAGVFNHKMGNAQFSANVEKKVGDDWEAVTLPRILLCTPTKDRVFTIYQGVVLTPSTLRVTFLNPSSAVDYVYVGQPENRFRISAGSAIPLFVEVRNTQAPAFEIVLDTGSAGTFRLYFDNGYGFIYEYDGEDKPQLTSEYGPVAKMVTPPPFDFEKAADYHDSEGMTQGGQYNYDSEEDKVLFYRIMIQNTSTTNSSAIVKIR